MPLTSSLPVLPRVRQRCRIRGCTAPARNRAWSPLCPRHWHRQVRYGDAEARVLLPSDYRQHEKAVAAAYASLPPKLKADLDRMLEGCCRELCDEAATMARTTNHRFTSQVGRIVVEALSQDFPAWKFLYRFAAIAQLEQDGRTFPNERAFRFAVARAFRLIAKPRAREAFEYRASTGKEYLRKWNPDLSMQSMAILADLLFRNFAAPVSQLRGWIATGQHIRVLRRAAMAETFTHARIVLKNRVRYLTKKLVALEQVTEEVNRHRSEVEGS